MPDDRYRTTLWTQTLLEVLMDGLRSQKTDRQILDTVVDLTDRGIDEAYLVDAAREQVGAAGGSRLRRILKARDT